MGVLLKSTETGPGLILEARRWANSCNLLCWKACSSFPAIAL